MKGCCNSPIRTIFNPSGNPFSSTEATGDYSPDRSNQEGVIRVTAEAIITFGDSAPSFVYIDNDSGGQPVTIAAGGSKSVEGSPLVFTEGSVIVYQDGLTHRVLGSGEINTNSNAGSEGFGLVKTKSGSDTPIKRLKAAIGSGRFFDYPDYVEYSAEGQYLTEAQDYITDASPAGDPEFIDDFYLFMKGGSDESSLTGISWSQLSEDLYAKLVTGYLLMEDYNVGSGVTVKPLKGALDGTIVGGMAWGANGFTGDGSTQRIDLGAAVITSGEWGFMAGCINPASPGIGEAIAGQNSSGAGRMAYALYEADGSLANFYHDGTGGRQAKTAVSMISANQRFVFSRLTAASGLQIFVNGETTAPGSQTVAGVVPGSYQNVNTNLLANPLPSQYANITLMFALFFAGNVDPADAAKVKSFMNTRFGFTMI